MKPVFIGGCPRSGTTFLASLLASHPNCVAVPESQFIVDTYRSLGKETGKLEAEKVLSRIERNWRYQVGWGDIAEELPKQRRSSRLPYPEIIKYLIEGFIEGRGNKKKSEINYWVDHTPSNIRRLEVLFKLFPDARAIHIVRDGRGCANSVIPLDWGPNTVKHASNWWLKNLSFGLAAENRWSHSKVFRVSYEDLLLEAEDTLKDITSWLEIDFKERMTEAEEIAVPRYTRNQHELIGSSGESDRATAWQQELRARQVEVFEYFAGPMLSYLGYPLNSSGEPEPPSTYEDLIFELKQVLKSRVVNRARKNYRKFRSLNSKKSRTPPAGRGI